MEFSPPPQGLRPGLCLKTTRSNLLQDADISRSRAGGQVGSRLPLTRCEIKTDPAGSWGGRRERSREKTTCNECALLLNLQYYFLIQLPELKQCQKYKLNWSHLAYKYIEFVCFPHTWLIVQFLDNFLSRFVLIICLKYTDYCISFTATQ